MKDAKDQKYEVGGKEYIVRRTIRFVLLDG